MHLSASFILSTVFGLLGLFYFGYGKKNQKYVARFTGIVLGVFPYFIPNAVAQFFVGAFLLSVPFWMAE